MSEEPKKFTREQLAIVNPQTVQYTLSIPEQRNKLVAVWGGEKEADRFVAAILNAMVYNPKLKECTAPSFYKSLYKCADYKLVPDGRTAAIVPYGKEATVIVMAQGYIELFARNGILLTVCDWRECDELTEINGQVSHSRNLIARATKGDKEYKLYGYTVHAQMPDGRIKSEIITMDYISGCRACSKNQDLWTKRQIEMEKKTCIRYIAKYLPQTSELKALMEEDDRANYDNNDFKLKTKPSTVSAESLFGGKSKKEEASNANEEEVIDLDSKEGEI